MAGKGSICKGCGLRFPTDQMYVISWKKYCEKCAQPFLKEAEDYKKLCKFIYEDIYNKDCNMPLITTQIRKLKDEFEDITNRRILLTLKYAINIEKVEIENLDPEWGVYNLIVKFYFSAKKFYAQRDRVNQDIAEIKEALTYKPIEIILRRSDLNRREIEEVEKRRIQEHKYFLEDDLVEDDQSEDINFDEEFGKSINVDKNKKYKQFKIRYDKLKNFKANT